MFDPSFFELIVICVVALIVLGPDKLPGAIKTLGLWIGRLRRSFNNIKREIEQEVGADEIRRQLRNEAIMEKFNKAKSQVTESIESVKKEADAVKNEIDIKKEFSGLTGDSSSAFNSEGSDEIDPIEKLATNDPAARVIKTDPEPEAAREAGSPDSSQDKSSTAPAEKPVAKKATKKTKQAGKDK
jgi:sec-independent protein translocase protein TatB